MTNPILRRTSQMIAVAGLMFMANSASAQSQNPTQSATPAPTMPCPMMQGGMGSGMKGQGGGMMNWQQMHQDMQALHQEIVKLREELQERGRR
jgi:TolA-binding protein